MPNWCFNNMEIKAVTSTAIQSLKKYKSFLLKTERGKDRTYLFDYFIPCPKELLEKSAPKITFNGKEYSDWYTFRTSEWGTKWDVELSSQNVDLSRNVIVLSIETAWSPPIEFYRFMEDNGFSVNATFFEEGMQFYGSFIDGVLDEREFPKLHGPAEILASDDSATLYVDNFDPSSIDIGDVIVTKCGRTLIYISHQFYSRERMKREFEEFNDPILDQHTSMYSRITDCEKEFYYVKLNVDQTDTREVGCLVFVDEMNALVFDTDDVCYDY